MGLGTLLLLVAALVVGIVLVHAMVHRPPANGAPDPSLLAAIGRTPTRLAVLGAVVVVLLLCTPYWIERPAAHDRATCGSALTPRSVDQFGLPRAPVPECLRARQVRFGAAGALVGLTVVSITVVLLRQRSAARRS